MEAIDNLSLKSRGSVAPKQQKSRSKKLSKLSKKISKTPKNVGKTQCPHCRRTFEKAQSLGGHMSKAHQGMSQIYANKMAIREARAPKRLLLKKAKDLILERDPNFNFKRRNSLVKQVKQYIEEGKDPQELLLKLSKWIIYLNSSFQK